ncbi:MULTISPECIES: MarR family winged helix-turn-helix transcriptional regulator [unclassified Achromobacter]|uniref:MarR family winged helix-turn-helix transcriptional regulator n=1 Tax=unclassified Achromobacter TaxID=2626865 RepID=UPI000B515A04|nr:MULTISPECIES: MarR family transcriptional regulator [unclassified Achromobacter]OWT77231.1 MarR family transcriptional regulator [Achromobacter sp. HZ28]OWT78112.1 MarR family transcriptional regulator [Achromobacter sp. HZ34]
MAKEQQGLRTVQQLGQTYRVMMTAFSAQVGHALPRWRILLALHEEGRCSQKMLAERCRLDPASLTRQLQAMEGLGWISRSIDEQDNRLINATLTAQGKRVVAEALPRRAEFFEHTLDGLTNKQMEVFHQVLAALEENFKGAQLAAQAQQAAQQATQP